jgi:hypothetical protein
MHCTKQETNEINLVIETNKEIKVKSKMSQSSTMERT